MGKKYTVLELFAGAGGLALGLEKAGFKTIGAVEIDSAAIKTLKSNRPNWNIIQGDISKINIKEHISDKVDFLSGGFPCQSFSYAGKRLGLEDTRGTLFYHYARILKDTMPKAFIAENVKGLVSHDKGRTLETILEVFKEVGYTVSYQVLTATGYEVAQKRQRIFIVGFRNDIYKEEFIFPKPSDKILTLRDILQNVPASPCTQYSETKKKVMEQVPAGGCWRHLPDEVAKEYMKTTYYMTGGRTGIARRLSWDEPGLTVLCSASQKQTERCHPDETRPFSVRENARIQSFPDDWVFEGSVSAQYKQVGNAVPVNMAKKVGEAVKDYLNSF